MSKEYEITGEMPQVLKNSDIDYTDNIFRFRYDDYHSNQALGNSLNEVIHSQIWHSTVQKLNDPFEVYFVQDEDDASSLSRSDLGLILSNTNMFKDKNNHDYIFKSFFNNDLDEIYGDIDAAIKSTMPSLREKFRKHVAMACFTKNADSRLMWGYYCSGFTGLCLIYNRMKLEEAGIKLQEVIYTNAPPKIKLSEWIIKQKRKQSLDGLLNFAKVKHKDWERELEYRRLVFLDHENVESCNTGMLIELQSKCLDGVIIGSNYNKEAKKLLREYCDRNDIKTFEAHVDLDYYQVSITHCNI